jgi:hypothetical protein
LLNAFCWNMVLLKHILLKHQWLGGHVTAVINLES